MKQTLASRFLKGSLQVLLSLSLATSLLLTGSLAAAAAAKHLSVPSKCPTIPTNFDFAHASTAALHHYLLPARPPASDQQATDDWQKAVARTVQTGGICVPDEKPLPVLNQGQPLTATSLHGDAAPASPLLTTKDNSHWVGYYVGNGSQPGYNEVVGDWIVDCVSDTIEGYPNKIVSWIGLGGVYPGDDLWQVGSGWDNTGDGYYLWYEALGVNHVNPIMKIHPTNCGDHIYADIWFAPNDPTSNVAFYLTDNGTPYRGKAPANFPSGSLSAEWIDERPACKNNQLGQPEFPYLADYGYSEWTHAYASPNNPTAGFYSIGQLPDYQVWMQDGGAIADPGPLGSQTGSGTDNFQTYFEGYGSNSC